MGFLDDEGTQQGNNPANQAMAEMRLVTIDQATVISGKGSCGPFAGVSRRLSMTAARCWGGVRLSRARPARHLFTELTDGSHLENGREAGRPQGIINLCSWCKRVPDQSGEWYDLATFIAERSAIQFNGDSVRTIYGPVFSCDGRHK